MVLREMRREGGERVQGKTDGGVGEERRAL
jgi:hypothetical protein